MQGLIGPLKELAEFEELCKNKKKDVGMIRVCGCVNSQKSHMMYALGDGCKYKVIACSSETKAKQIYEEYRFLDSNTYLYPAKDFLFYQADIRSKELVKQRMEGIQAVLSGEPVTVVTSLDGFMDHLAPKESIAEKVLKIQNDSVLKLDEMAEKLSVIGYDREVQVEGPGQFAVRGGILDIYPLTEELPVRIELWGDEVDSIRTFDVESQRSIENLMDIVIYPAVEFPQNGEKGVSFLDYFPPEDTILFLDEPVRLVERGQNIEDEFMEAQKKRLESGYDLEEEEAKIFPVTEILKKINCYSSIGFYALEMKCKGLEVRESYEIQAKSVNPYNNSFELLTRDLKKLKRTGYRVILVSGSRTRAKRLAEDLRDYDLSSFYSEEMERQVNPGEIMVTCGYIAEGYEYPMLKFTVISESDIFGKKKKKKKRKSYEGKKIQEFAELKPGDYVVHENHGLGIYQGIEKIEVDAVTRDYMKISYADGGILYILATQLDLIQKYAGADAKPPKLNKLGTPQWKKTKGQVKKAVQLIAKDLVKLYATRQQTDGYVYGPDTVWQREFEEMFPFEETEDQLRAIEDTKKDMESTKIMDRLICGDVGYGKTEIAIRAAFKAVQEGKQVVYLVPTTILAQQHYNTFIQRFKDFPVRVDLMSRFRTQAQQKKTVEDLKKGLVDIVIGTHRVLSKDVGYKDLGLLIIDEEQLAGMRESSKINIAVLDYVAENIHAGMTTQDIDDLVYQKTTEMGGIPAPLNYEGFPKSVCTSINEQVCHGIPSKNIQLLDGDIINVDCSTILNGYFSDSSRMFCIGNVAPEHKKLVDVAKECVELGLAQVKPWGHLGDVAAAINEHAKANGYSVVREVGGHGIGLEFHETPFVSYVIKKGTGMVMAPGMVFTIEPMINVIIFNLLGDCIQDLMNPKGKK